MPDAKIDSLVERIDGLLEEVAESRKSFDEAIRSIRRDKFNTRILYSLVAVLILVVGSVVFVYHSNRTGDCKRGNQLRAAVVQSLSEQAANIGTSLAVVTNAPPERLAEYLEVYAEQPVPDALLPRDC